MESLPTAIGENRLELSKLSLNNKKMPTPNNSRIYRRKLARAACLVAALIPSLGLATFEHSSFQLQGGPVFSRFDLSDKSGDSLRTVTSQALRIEPDYEINLSKNSWLGVSGAFESFQFSAVPNADLNQTSLSCWDMAAFLQERWSSLAFRLLVGLGQVPLVAAGTSNLSLQALFAPRASAFAQIPLFGRQRFQSHLLVGATYWLPALSAGNGFQLHGGYGADSRLAFEWSPKDYRLRPGLAVGFQWNRMSRTDGAQNYTQLTASLRLSLAPRDKSFIN